MSTLEQSAVCNRLLRVMSAEAFALLRPNLEPIELDRGTILLEADTPYKWAYFLDSGLASVVTVSSLNRHIELGLFGREGIGSIAIILDAQRSPHRTVMQVAGAGHRILATNLRQAMHRVPDLTTLLLRYVQVFLVQVSQTALSNGSFSIEDRLARWLLLTHDRLDGDDIALTHEFLSTMLGVRRTGVTLAVQMLEGRGLVRARRGLLTIIDRHGLEETAAYGYGQAEREYERLIGSFR